MRTALPLIALMLTTGAAAQQDGRSARGPDAQDRLILSVPLPDRPSNAGAACTDRIHEVGEEQGLPGLERGTAAPDEPLSIAAVDHRIDGCSVMVMRYDTRDVRPVPTDVQPPQMERIPGQ